jgi:hypothetical protein
MGISWSIINETMIEYRVLSSTGMRYMGPASRAYLAAWNSQSVSRSLERRSSASSDLEGRKEEEEREREREKREERERERERERENWGGVYVFVWERKRERKEYMMIFEKAPRRGLVDRLKSEAHAAKNYSGRILNSLRCTGKT